MEPFNVYSMRSRLLTISILRGNNEPDLLCLTESKLRNKDFPAAASSNTDYQAVFRHEPSCNGVAIISK